MRARHVRCQVRNVSRATFPRARQDLGMEDSGRPVRFVALSEDGHALVLADEVGRLLTLPIDDRVTTALDPAKAPPPGTVTIAAVPFDGNNSLSPRDIQARIRSGESA